MSTLTASPTPIPKWLVYTIALGAGAVFLSAILTPKLLRSRDVADQARLYSMQHGAGSAAPDLQYSPAASEHAVEITAGSASPVSIPGGIVSGQLQSTTLMADKAVAPAKSRASASTDRKIVRTGALELTVKSPADASEQIRLMAESMGGYLESAQIGGTKDAPVANITIRIPAVRFEDAKAGIRKLAARVESEKTDAQDVTREYVDMEARLHNLRAEEAQYLTIMKSAYKVDDLLSVSEKLSEVRGEIEQQQAEFQTLSKQVETVAIAVSLHTVVEAQVSGLNWRPLYQLKVAARDGLDALADYASTMAAILFYVPAILAWTLTLLFTGLLGWRLVRWTGRRLHVWPAVPVAEKVTGSI